jgi:hypothetical protein
LFLSPRLIRSSCWTTSTTISAERSQSLYWKPRLESQMRLLDCRNPEMRIGLPSSVERIWSWVSRSRTSSLSLRERRAKLLTSMIALIRCTESWLRTFQSLKECAWIITSRTQRLAKTQTQLSLQNLT